MSNIYNLKSLPNGGGGKNENSGSGGGDGMLEARVAKLESDVEYIKRDVGEIKGDLKTCTIQIYGIKTWIAVATAVTGLFVGAIAWIFDRKFEAIMNLLSQ